MWSKVCAPSGNCMCEKKITEARKGCDSNAVNLAFKQKVCYCIIKTIERKNEERKEWKRDKKNRDLCLYY